MKIILSKIRLARNKKEYSQEYMAEKLSMSQKAYCKLEKGQTKLSVKRLKEIGLILDLNITTLL